MLNRPYDNSYHGAALMGEPEAWDSHRQHERPRAQAAPWRQTYVEERLSAADYRASPPPPAQPYAPRPYDPAGSGDFHELARSIEARRHRNRMLAVATGQSAPLKPARRPEPSTPAPQRYAAADWTNGDPRYAPRPRQAEAAPARAPERPRPYYERETERAQAPAPEHAPAPARRPVSWLDNVRETVRVDEPDEAPAKMPAEDADRRIASDARTIAALQKTIEALEARIARLEARPPSRFELARQRADATAAVAAAKPAPTPLQSRSARLREAARAEAARVEAERTGAVDAGPVPARDGPREQTPRRLWA